MTVRELVKQAEEKLLEAGIGEAANDARELMMFLKGWNLTEYLMQASGKDGGAELSAADLARYREMTEKRAARIPLQHLTGKAYFYGYEFSVNPSVLIPRYDTEILVQAVLSENGGNAEGKAVLDLCTGSGCIACVLSLEGRFGQVDASDISEDALDTAKSNAEALGAGVRFFSGDLFSAIGEVPGARYDLIVCNPPYIAETERESLDPEVRFHDPETALFGGEDGLLFYRRIITEAPAFLKPGGKLYFEIGSSEAGAVSELMRDRGFSDIRVYPDLSGKDRAVRGVWNR